MNTYVLSVLLNLVSSLMEPFFSIVFVSAFMGERFDKRKKDIAALTIIIQFIFCMFADKVAIFSILKFLICHLISLTGLWVIYLKNYDRVFFITIIDMVSIVFIESIVAYAIAFVFQAPLKIILQGTRYRVVGIILALTFKCIFAFGIKICFKDARMLRRNSMIVIALLSSGIMALTLYLSNDCLKKAGVSFLQMLMAAILTIMYILVIFSIFMLDDNRNKGEELALITLHSEILNKSLLEERTTFDMWRNRLHDYKNQLIYIRELLEKQQYKKISEIVDKEIGELKRQSIYIESGYLGIDAIINSKLMYAQGKGIHTIYNIKIPSGLKIDDEVVSSILGNLIDNAIRASLLTEEKYFEINIVYVFENLNIKISNTISSKRINFEKSSKSQSGLHGIGINSVRNNVKRLHGTFDIAQHENIVVAAVKIPVKK